MKILHVVPFLPRASGVSVFACEVAREMAVAGHAVTLGVARRRADDLPADERVRVADLKDVLASGLRGFDVVHLHGLWSWPLHRAAASARRAGVSVATSPHGMLRPWALHHKFLKKFLGLALYQSRDLRKASLLHVTTADELGDVRRLGFGAPAVVAPLGVAHPPKDADGGGARLVSENGVRTVLFVGRLHPVKGIPDLLGAWSRLPPGVRAAWRLRLVGADEGGHEAFLRARCRALSLVEGMEIVFAGAKHGDDLLREYAAASLLVLPSLSENFGGVVVDALAHGKPVIAAKTTPWAELDAERCGWWSDGDAAGLATTLQYALSLSDAERAEMGARGRSLAAAKYTWRATCETLLAAYGKLRG